MSILTDKVYGTSCGIRLYYAYRPEAGTESIVITGGTYVSVIVVSYVGVVLNEPFFEGTNTNSAPSATSIAVSVAAGTTGRRVIGLNGNSRGASFSAITPAAGFSEINEIDVQNGSSFGSHEMEYRDIDGAASAGGSGTTATWVAIGTAILPLTIYPFKHFSSGILQVIEGAQDTFKVAEKLALDLTVQCPALYMKSLTPIIGFRLEGREFKEAARFN